MLSCVHHSLFILELYTQILKNYAQILFIKEAINKVHENFVKFKADNISNKYNRFQNICRAFVIEKILNFNFNTLNLAYLNVFITLLVHICQGKFTCM